MTREDIIKGLYRGLDNTKCKECMVDISCRECVEKEFDEWLSEHDKEIKAQVYNEAFEIVLEEEHQITTFADKIGIKILKKKNEMLKGEVND